MSHDSKQFDLQSATYNDGADLAIFADMATRRLASFLWGQLATSGQSALEFGRNAICNNETHYTHFTNWRVVKIRGEMVGAINCYLLPTSTAAPSGHEVAQPLNELKAVAAGSWYIAHAAIYPKFQGSGAGRLLLCEAEKLANAAGNGCLTLMVGSFNKRAYTVYQKFGFQEWERRPFVPFTGADERGDWILMRKSL